MRIQLRRAGGLKEHTSVSNKMAALEGELDPETLESSQEYQRMQARLQHLGDSLTENLDAEATSGGPTPDDTGQEPSAKGERLEELSEGLDEL
jgi:hypothetical protein